MTESDSTPVPGADGEISKPGQPPARLSVRDLSVERAGRQVLRGVNFEIRPGEVVGLLGRNGAGKTTLFQVLCGLLDPGSGEFALDGRQIKPGHREFRSRCGVVFQEPALDPRLTARQNLALAAGLYGVGRRDATRRMEDLLERVGLADRGNDPVSRLSGGMRRRVELIRALIHEPEVLVLDEPTTGLDEAAFRRIWAELLGLRDRRGLTMLLTTHRADEAEHCDRIGILDGGRLVALDTPERLRARVRGDLLVIETEETARLIDTLRERFAVEAHSSDGRVFLHRERAHELIPRIVEVLPEGALRSISMRHTGLGEVFLELTGHELDDDGLREARP
jgi:ABC-2 type transport system ATP-binding protein